MRNDPVKEKGGAASGNGNGMDWMDGMDDINRKGDMSAAGGLH